MSYLRLLAISLAFLATLSISLTIALAVETTPTVYLPIVLKPVSTPTPIPTPTPPTPTPTATPAPTGVRVLPNHSYYVDSIDYLHIVGEVANYTGQNLQLVKVIADVYNNSQLAANAYTYAYLDNLPAGERTCFHLSMQKPANWTSYQFEPASYWTNGQPLPNLAVVSPSASYNPTFDWYQIIGMVRNDAGHQVRFVSPVGTLYNNNGTVIDCDFTYVNSTDLAAGQSSSFSMNFIGGNYSDVSNYRLQVDGQ